MIQVKGTYNKGNITLDKALAIDKTVKVTVLFDEEDIDINQKRLSLNDFSFLNLGNCLKM